MSKKKDDKLINDLEAQAAEMVRDVKTLTLEEISKRQMVMDIAIKVLALKHKVTLDAGAGAMFEEGGE